MEKYLLLQEVTSYIIYKQFLDIICTYIFCLDRQKVNGLKMDKK